MMPRPDEAHVERALEGQDDEPGEGAQDFRHPHRHEQADEEQRHVLRVRHLGQVEGHGIAEDEGDDGGDRAVEQGVDEHLHADRRLERQDDRLPGEGQPELPFRRLLEGGAVVGERVDVLRAADVGKRQVEAEALLQQVELRQNHQHEQPEGREAHEDPGERVAVAAEELGHSSMLGSFMPWSARTRALAASKHRYCELPMAGSVAGPSLRVSTVTWRPVLSAA